VKSSPEKNSLQMMFIKKLENNVPIHTVMSKGDLEPLVVKADIHPP
jgi:hypothetical protein